MRSAGQGSLRPAEDRRTLESDVPAYRQGNQQGARSANRNAGHRVHVAERAALRATLIQAAHTDPRISGAALTGSAALDREDRWSDIDLALSVTGPEADVVADWTEGMFAETRAVDHVDLFRAGTRFRVFLLASTLQVDVAFWPQAE